MEFIALDNLHLFKKNEKKHENRLPTPDKVKKGYRYYCSLVAAVALMGCCTMIAFAAPAGGDPLTVINNLSDFIFGLICAVGLMAGASSRRDFLSRATTPPGVPTAS